MQKDYLKIVKYKLRSRLIVGTGKYKNFKETAKAIKASGADMVTVAVRRVNIIDKKNNKVGIFDLGNHILIIGLILIVIFVSLNVD